jgi:hypothetical protein
VPVVLPEQALPAKLILNPDLAMSDDEFFEFCVANPDVWFERTEEGEISSNTMSTPDSAGSNCTEAPPERTARESVRPALSLPF